ncbi:MAG TPA: hypothetical protein PKN20_06820, partial [Verrucomicrobiota bacterium]|nr:hypothetical protein [Verrucomicrobiota bacterium]HOH40165.1 hypothetical protein [Verrucomicrobiota bacterium]
MKLLDSPRSGRLGAYVYYTTPFGQCCRALTMPRDARSPAQARARASFAARVVSVKFSKLVVMVSTQG